MDRVQIERLNNQIDALNRLAAVEQQPAAQQPAAQQPAAQPVAAVQRSKQQRDPLAVFTSEVRSAAGRLLSDWQNRPSQRRSKSGLQSGGIDPTVLDYCEAAAKAAHDIHSLLVVRCARLMLGKQQRSRKQPAAQPASSVKVFTGAAAAERLAHAQTGRSRISNFGKLY